jgi:hypothetical protein
MPYSSVTGCINCYYYYYYYAQYCYSWDAPFLSLFSRFVVNIFPFYSRRAGVRHGLEDLQSTLIQPHSQDCHQHVSFVFLIQGFLLWCIHARFVCLYVWGVTCTEGGEQWHQWSVIINIERSILIDLFFSCRQRRHGSTLCRSLSCAFHRALERQRAIWRPSHSHKNKVNVFVQLYCRRRR